MSTIVRSMFSCSRSHDDETLCDIPGCQLSCCIGYALDSNNQHIKVSPKLTYNFRAIILRNNQLKAWNNNLNQCNHYLIRFDCSSNFITLLPILAYEMFPRVCGINLSSKNIYLKHFDALRGLLLLVTLDISRKPLSFLYRGVFSKLHSLTCLYLGMNLI